MHNIPPDVYKSAENLAVLCAMRWFSGLKKKPVCVDRDDVRQVAKIAVFRAAQRFDISRGSSFRQFAKLAAIGAVQHLVRDNRSELTTRREHAELGNMCTRGEDAYAHLRKEKHAPLSIHHPISSDIRNGNVGDDFCRSTINIEETILVKEALSMLPVFQRTAFIMVSMYRYSQLEVAQVLGCSQMHVSRMVRKAQAALVKYYQG